MLPYSKLNFYFLGVLPDTVIEHDIDPVVDLDTAHERYMRF